MSDREEIVSSVSVPAPEPTDRELDKLGEILLDEAGDSDDWITLATGERINREQFVDLCELEEHARLSARFEVVESLGLTEAEIRVKAAEIAGTVISGYLAGGNLSWVENTKASAIVVKVAKGLEPYLRGEAI